MKGFLLIFLFLLFFKFSFSFEKNLIIENCSFDLWDKGKLLVWETNNCEKGKGLVNYGFSIVFRENGECKQKLKNIQKGKDYRLEFIYRLPDYGDGDIKWKIIGVKGENLSGRFTTPYFHTKPIRAVTYFKVNEVEKEPEIIFMEVENIQGQSLMKLLFLQLKVDLQVFL
jgi:hypothetical protein